MKRTNIWNRMSAWLRAFLILALVFLVLGLGTLGSAVSTGKAYALSSRRATDGKEPCIVLNVTDPGHGEENHEHRDLYIKEVYFNLGAIYTDYGEVVTIQIARGTTSDSQWYNYSDIQFANFYEKLDEGDKSVNPITDALYNWVKFPVAERLAHFHLSLLSHQSIGRQRPHQRDRVRRKRRGSDCGRDA